MKTFIAAAHNCRTFHGSARGLLHTLAALSTTERAVIRSQSRTYPRHRSRLTTVSQRVYHHLRRCLRLTIAAPSAVPLLTVTAPATTPLAAPCLQKQHRPPLCSRLTAHNRSSLTLAAPIATSVRGPQSQFPLRPQSLIVASPSTTPLSTRCTRTLHPLRLRTLNSITISDSVLSSVLMIAERLTLASPVATPFAARCS